MDPDSGHPGRPRVVTPLAPTRLKTPGRDPAPTATYSDRRELQPQAPEPSSVLLGKWFISGRSAVEGGPCYKQRLVYEVTVYGLTAIQADFFQGSYQLGQCRAKLLFMLEFRLASPTRPSRGYSSSRTLAVQNPRRWRNLSAWAATTGTLVSSTSRRA